MVESFKNPFSLQGKSILITGAAGGMGSATARLMSNLGAKLVLVDICDGQKIASVVGELPGEARMFTCDTSDRSAVEALAEKVGAIDALVDTAGLNPFDNWEEEGWEDSFDRVMAVNAKGPLNLVRAFYPSLRASEAGRIVLVGSFAGRAGGFRNGPHYAVSKGGIHALIRWFARRFAEDNVLVNGIAPGVTATPMMTGQDFPVDSWPLKRMATAEEQAAPIAFLCSSAASYITGAVLDVNGGVYFS